MQQPTTQAVRRQRGFTLIELTVVLMILIALAGILIPTLSGYVERSHASAASTNIGEINKFVQLYHTKYLKGWGANYDSLLDATNTTENGFYKGLPAELKTTGPGSLLTVTALDAAQAASLIDGGIDRIATMTPAASFTGDLSITYNANEPDTYPLVATGTSVAILSDDQARKALGYSVAQVASEDYVVFGLGQRNSLIGKVMADAPLHFDQADPKEVYSRFLVVFAIPQPGATVGFKARFVGALGAEAGGLGEHLGTYFSKDAE